MDQQSHSSDPRQSLLALLRAWAGEGELELPDEAEHGRGKVHFASGAWDGIATHHMGASDAGALNTAAEDLMKAIGRAVAGAADRDLEALSALARREGTSLAALADVLTERITSQDRFGPAELAPVARWLVRTSAHREPLKLGVVLLGLCGSDEDLADLKTLARHDEFTLYALVAAGRIVEDPTDVWWEMARSVDGWGKIHLVERLADLAANRPDLRAWLLRHGCSNWVMNEYLAYTCATAGGLAEALAAPEADDELLDGACLIVRALLAGGPARDIDDYEDGAVAAARLLDHLAWRCDTLERLSTVEDLRRWLEWPTTDDSSESEELWEQRRERGWSDAIRARLAAACDRILSAPEWPDKVRASYVAGSDLDRYRAWDLSKTVGVDLWDDGFARLEAEPLDSGLYYQLAETDEPARMRSLLAFAERRLPLGEISTGPADELGGGPLYAAHSCLGFLLQAMQRPGVFSGRLVAAGLRSPVIRNRHMAASALEAHPPSEWGEAVAAALRLSLADECNPDVLARLRALSEREE